MSRPDIGEFRPHEHESAGERSTRIAKENPMIGLGVAGAVGIVLYRIFNVKKRNQSQRFANYVIYTRIYAQGLLVVCFGYGIVVNMVSFYRKKWFGTPAGEKIESAGTKSIEGK